ncbi:hypothetical protein VPH35_036891 [Triticum aestivum]
MKTSPGPRTHCRPPPPTHCSGASLSCVPPYPRRTTTTRAPPPPSASVTMMPIGKFNHGGAFQLTVHALDLLAAYTLVPLRQLVQVRARGHHREYQVRLWRRRHLHSRRTPQVWGLRQGHAGL